MTMPENRMLAALIDLDDTLLYTNDLVVESLLTIAFGIAANKDLDTADVYEVVKETNYQKYKQFHVNRHLSWPPFIQSLKEKYDLDGHLTGLIETQINSIYTSTPELMEGATELLLKLNSLRCKICIVTHADEEWTQFKLESTGLARFIDPGMIFYADVNRAKGLEDYQGALELVNVPPENIVSIGDSIPGDILPAVELGFGKVIHIDNGQGWGEYKKGKIPESVYKVTSLREAMPMILPEAREGRPPLV